jgi:putative membrane protein
MEQNTNEVGLKKEPYSKLIVAVSILIPVLVAVLFGVKVPGYDFSFLPPIYATINGVTAILLVTAVIAIKQKKRVLHERLMKTCVALSATFLVLYVIYHMTSDSTSYGGVGPLRYLYFFILITHILLSIGVIPMVLFTYLRAWKGEFSRHRALAKYTFPLWLYVAITGVIVYLMISPYYL